MRSLLAMLLCVLSVPALAVDPPDYQDTGNLVIIYDDDGVTLTRQDKAFLIEQDGDGHFVGTVQQETLVYTGSWPLTPTIITHTYPIGAAPGTEMPNTLAALESSVGTVRRLRCFITCTKAQPIPLSKENIEYTVTKVLPVEPEE